MARTPYSDPYAEKAYQEMAANTRLLRPDGTPSNVGEDRDTLEKFINPDYKPK